MGAGTAFFRLLSTLCAGRLTARHGFPLTLSLHINAYVSRSCGLPFCERVRAKAVSDLSDARSPVGFAVSLCGGGFTVGLVVVAAPGRLGRLALAA
jgi:hypothetical protein